MMQCKINCEISIDIQTYRKLSIYYKVVYGKYTYGNHLWNKGLGNHCVSRLKVASKFWDVDQERISKNDMAAQALFNTEDLVNIYILYIRSNLEQSCVVWSSSTNEETMKKSPT